MPTYEPEPRFLDDYATLTPAQRVAFRRAIAKLVHDLRDGPFCAGLHVHALEGHPGVYAMAWAPDGRATFHYGAAVHEGEAHVIWRRVGTHAIYDQP